ncbi:YteA family regulatory protein [Sporosarcina luteola]|nr:YteA family regulatory protein [Sporosarcina luteola]
MLSDKQLAMLKDELLELKGQLTKTEEQTNTVDSQRDVIGELSMYDNHPADMGTELFDRQKDMALNEHADAEIGKVDDALEAIQNGTYGKCEVCHEDIPYERLEALPYTTVCIEHTSEKEIPSDRPSEKDILIMAEEPNTFANRHDDDSIEDSEDSFQEIAKSGTSETPSDFVGDRADYNTLYDDPIADGAAEEYEEFTSTDISAEERGFIRSSASAEYEENLDQEGLESPVGDIPYRRGDSYIEEEKK